MGQKQTTVNNYTTTNVVKGSNNSVVPSTSTTNKLSPTQSISPSTSLSVARKAGDDLNPTACAPGTVSVNNNWRDYIQSLFAGDKTALSHIARSLNGLSGNGPSIKESLDNVAAVSTASANNINNKLSDVIRDMSHEELSSKLRLLENGGTTGMFGGAYNISDENLAVELNTTMERINSAPNTIGVSTTKIAQRADVVFNAFMTMRNILELLSRPLNSYFTPNSTELNTTFAGPPYEPTGAFGTNPAGFDVPPSEETNPADSTDITAYAVTATFICSVTDFNTSPLVNTHSTNFVSSDVVDSGPMRIIGKVTNATGSWATFFVDFILNRQAVSFEFPSGMEVYGAEFKTTILDVSQVKLNIPSDRVEGLTISENTTGLDCLGRIAPAGASTGPGDVRSLWHQATVGIAAMTNSILSHTGFQQAKATIMKELSKYLSVADESLEQLAEDLMTQVPLYPYTIGPIGRLIAYGVSPKDIYWMVFSTLNLLDTLSTSYTYSPDQAALAYGNRIAAIAAARPTTYANTS